VPGSVGIVLFDNAGFFLDDLSFGARAGHGRAEEYVNDQHDDKQDPESDAQVEQPQRLNPRARRHSHCNSFFIRIRWFATQ